MTEGQQRVGDSDREAAVTALADHYAAGRLTKEEFDERADSVWAARTTADVGVLFTDLPHPGAATAAPRPPAAPRPATPRGHGPRWLPPVLVVMAVLVVLTHAPQFLLLGLIWIVLTRGGHRGVRRLGPWQGHWDGRRRHQGYGR